MVFAFFCVMCLASFQVILLLSHNLSDGTASVSRCTRIHARTGNLIKSEGKGTYFPYIIRIFVPNYYDTLRSKEQ